MILRCLEMFAAVYAYVMLRALQQRNVAFDNYGWILPVSMFMACADIFIVVFIAHSGWVWQLVLANGIGGCLGCLSAMWFHRRFIKHAPK